MSIVNIIYIIAAILFVVRIVNRNKQKVAEGEKENQKKRTFESMRPEAVAQNQKTSTVYVNQNKNAKQKNNKAKKTTLSQGKNQTFASLAAVDVKDEPRSGESMTDYLSRKAREEEVERKREEWEERREEQKNVGNLRLAKQLVFGDVPPKGSIVKKCPYCGAENLIPQMSREKYHCYFCRSSLK